MRTQLNKLDKKNSLGHVGENDPILHLPVAKVCEMLGLAGNSKVKLELGVSVNEMTIGCEWAARVIKKKTSLKVLRECITALNKGDY